MKDFYWDIRPKPEYSTIEIRIGDTPLTVEKAAELGAYAQLLVCWLLDKKPIIHRDIYYTYLINRFRAARFGFDAIIVDPIKDTQIPLVDDILQTCDKLGDYAKTMKSSEALARIREAVLHRSNGAKWLKKQFADLNSLEDTVRCQSNLWMQGTHIEIADFHI
jgi:carboxylate-amine ligase